MDRGAILQSSLSNQFNDEAPFNIKNDWSRSEKNYKLGHTKFNSTDAEIA
jgi:hypothetical protein